MSRKAVNPNQLKMFMSADEITRHYQPWDNDRMDYSDMWGSSPTSFTYEKASTRTTHANEPSVRPHRGRYETETRGGGYGMRSTFGTLYRAVPKESSGGGGVESDEELWERKAGEADMYAAHGYAAKHRDPPERGEPTLYEDIAAKGVSHPVALGTQVGSQGKPQITGGHHRIAVMRDVAPHNLLPVLHFQGGLGATRRVMEERMGGYR
jgi:hypothetical protein